MLDTGGGLNAWDAPASIRANGAAKQTPSAMGIPAHLSSQLAVRSDDSFERLRQRALELWESLGVPARLGTYAWAVESLKSANGRPRRCAAPQKAFTAPRAMVVAQR